MSAPNAHVSAANAHVSTAELLRYHGRSWPSLSVVPGGVAGKAAKVLTILNGCVSGSCLEWLLHTLIRCAIYIYLLAAMYTSRHYVFLCQGNAAWDRLHTVIVEDLAESYNTSAKLRTFEPVQLHCGPTIVMFACQLKLR